MILAARKSAAWRASSRSSGQAPRSSGASIPSRRTRVVTSLSSQIRTRTARVSPSTTSTTRAGIGPVKVSPTAAIVPWSTSQPPATTAIGRPTR
jgi:hypothetical protein